MACHSKEGGLRLNSIHYLRHASDCAYMQAGELFCSNSLTQQVYSRLDIILMICKFSSLVFAAFYQLSHYSQRMNLLL